MKIETKKFALNFSLAMGLIFVVCAIFVSLWPDFSAKLLGWLFHTKARVFEMRKEVTFANFTGGLVQVVVYTYVLSWIFAWAFNKSSR